MKRAALGSVLVALAILIAGPAPQAAAHTELVLSTPDDGAVLPAVPDEVELSFSEDLLPDAVVVSVVDSAGMAIRVLELEVDGPDVLVTWPPGLSGTDFTVNYRVVSQDGHPVSGSVAFTVDSPSATPVPSPAPASAMPSPAPEAEPASGSAVPIAAISAGLGVGIAIGFLFWISRRRSGAGGPGSPGLPS